MKKITLLFFIILMAHFSFSQTNGATKKVVLEQFNGAWNGYCPDSDFIMENILTQYPDNVIGISIHSLDGMAYDNGIEPEFSNGVTPVGMVDRKKFTGESNEILNRNDWGNYVVEQLTRYTPAEVDLTINYDSATRTITGTITAEFIDSASGDMRFVMSVVEDEVTETGSDFDQTNYYDGASGHPFEGAGNPIIGYTHRHVLRANLPGVYGNAGIIPPSVSAGSIYSETFIYTLPANYDETKISVIGFLAFSVPEIGQREILNADQKPLSEVLSIEKESLFGSLSISPNPTNNHFTLNLNLKETITADIIMYNIFGQEIKRIASGTFDIGDQAIQVSVENVLKEVYFVTIRTATDSLTKKLVVK
ncbi:Omp28-related outer membrane protein [Aequorivita capsosiphonis]|uniref:Omp28-related outer membrane protein n=1 Tax=Aequorivita capsosiphonis TaxID=487317 RepID=UPI00040118A3|nr:Omp28-related outer membrane protein [Aequorivita capsosiphonis]